MASSRGAAWQRPALRDDGEAHRPVGWVELFFDLVFVVVVAVLAAELERDPSGVGVAGFLLQFVAIFWVWNGFTYYTERFESRGVESRLFVLVGVVTAAGLAIWGSDGLGGNYAGFALCYLVARGFNITLWLRAAFHEPRFRPAALSFTAGWLVALPLLGLAALAEGPLRLALFGAGVLLDIASPAIGNRFQAGLPPISRDKFPERFGLFTLIVLGETIAGIIRVAAEVESEEGVLPVPTGIDAAIGILIGFGLWWVYFDVIARRPPRPVFVTALVWVYFHVAALASIVTAGAGVSLAIGDEALEPMPDAHRLLLSAGSRRLCCSSRPSSSPSTGSPTSPCIRSRARRSRRRSVWPCSPSGSGDPRCRPSRC